MSLRDYLQRRGTETIRLGKVEAPRTATNKCTGITSPVAVDDGRLRAGVVDEALLAPLIDLAH